MVSYRTSILAISLALGSCLRLDRSHRLERLRWQAAVTGRNSHHFSKKLSAARGSMRMDITHFLSSWPTGVPSWCENFASCITNGRESDRAHLHALPELQPRVCSQEHPPARVRPKSMTGCLTCSSTRTASNCRVLTMHCRHVLAAMENNPHAWRARSNSPTAG